MVSGSDISGPSSPFPLGGVVAFCGSRHGSAFPCLSRGGGRALRRRPRPCRLLLPASMPPFARAAPPPWWCAPLPFPVRPVPALQLAPVRWLPVLRGCASLRPPAASSAPAPLSPSGALCPLAFRSGTPGLGLSSLFPGRLSAWRACPVLSIFQHHPTSRSGDFPANQANLPLGKHHVAVLLLYAHNQCGV